MTRLTRLMLLLSVLLWATPGQAETFWDEDFENHLYPQWTGATGCTPLLSASNPDSVCGNPSLSTDTAHSGTHSLKSVYNATCGMDSGPGCGSFMDRFHPAVGTVFLRWWEKLVSFTPNDVTGSKFVYNKSSTVPDETFWHIFPGQVTHGAQVNSNFYNRLCPNGSTDSSCNLFSNAGNVNVLDAQWHCVETQMTASGANLSNGLARLWVDGTLVLEYLNMPTTNVPTTYDFITLYTQMGNGTRYVDDQAVGDTRIGCGGSGSGGDTTPPAVPTGLAVR